MTLEELYEMQKVLDQRIIDQHNLHGQDLLPNTVLALQVEIAELANEHRCFKHWSNDREPRTKKEIGKCQECEGTGDENFHTEYAPFESCAACAGLGANYKNPLLEEYVDCLHFLMSIARQLGLPADDLYVPEDDPDGETSILFVELMHNVGLIIGDHFLLRKPDELRKWRREQLRQSLFIFYALGDKRLGFTFDQIAEAYVAKNLVNHERQQNGY